MTPQEVALVREALEEKVERMLRVAVKLPETSLGRKRLEERAELALDLAEKLGVE